MEERYEIMQAENIEAKASMGPGINTGKFVKFILIQHFKQWQGKLAFKYRVRSSCS